MSAFSQEPFTEEEKDQILRLLGYPNWASLAQSIQLGYPSASQPAFLVFDAFQRVRPHARASIRKDLCRALSVDSQIADSQTRRKTTKVGTVELNAGELGDLMRLLAYWTTRIADQLGVVPNPYSQHNFQGAPGGVNATVEG